MAKFLMSMLLGGLLLILVQHWQQGDLAETARAAGRTLAAALN